VTAGIGVDGSLVEEAVGRGEAVALGIQVGPAVPVGCGRANAPPPTDPPPKSSRNVLEAPANHTPMYPPVLAWGQDPVERVPSS
jgi:hypothetical protein